MKSEKKGSREYFYRLFQKTEILRAGNTYIFKKLKSVVLGAGRAQPMISGMGKISKYTTSSTSALFIFKIQ